MQPGSGSRWNTHTRTHTRTLSCTFHAVIVLFTKVVESVSRASWRSAPSKTWYPSALVFLSLSVRQRMWHNSSTVHILGSARCHVICPQSTYINETEPSSSTDPWSERTEFDRMSLWCNATSLAVLLSSTEIKENEKAPACEDQWLTYSPFFLTHQSDYLSYMAALVKRRRGSFSFWNLSVLDGRWW